MMSRGPDEPQFNVFPNQARPGLVHVEIGTGAVGYDVTPGAALELADRLSAAAAMASSLAGRET